MWIQNIFNDIVALTQKENLCFEEEEDIIHKEEVILDLFVSDDEPI